MYKDMAVASSYGTGPPLALYDLIGQKAPPISYAYSCDMSIVGEEDEQEPEDDTVPPYHSTPIPPPPHASMSHEGDTTQESQTRTEMPQQHHPEEIQSDAQPQHPLPSTTEIRPPITQRETFPQTSSKRPNWQTMRYQTTPGRAHKAQLEAWVSGWSAAVGELGDETYCACADGHSSSPPGTPSRRDDGKEQTERGRQKADATTSGSGPRAGGVGVSFVCRNCSRQPSPAVIPDQEFVFPPAAGGPAGRMALRCKLVWKRIVDKTVRRRSSPDNLGGEDGGGRGGLEDGRAANAPVSQAGGYGGGYDEEDDEEDDDEVDVDGLSRSSREGGAPRGGDDIAERQARLRRAQRLLRKGSAGMREAG